MTEQKYNVNPKSNQEVSSEIQQNVQNIHETNYFQHQNQNQLPKQDILQFRLDSFESRDFQFPNYIYQQDNILKISQKTQDDNQHQKSKNQTYQYKISTYNHQNFVQPKLQWDFCSHQKMVDSTFVDSCDGYYNTLRYKKADNNFPILFGGYLKKHFVELQKKHQIQQDILSEFDKITSQSTNTHNTSSRPGRYFNHKVLSRIFQSQILHSEMKDFVDNHFLQYLDSSKSQFKTHYSQKYFPLLLVSLQEKKWL